MSISYADKNRNALINSSFDADNVEDAIKKFKNDIKEITNLSYVVLKGMHKYIMLHPSRYDYKFELLDENYRLIKF